MELTAQLFFGTPGSGKTSSLLAQLRVLAQSGVPAQSVLALTPSRQSAAQLRDRAILVTGWAATQDVVRSLQSVAYELLRREAAEKGEPDPVLLTGAAQAALLKQILNGEFGVGLRSNWSLPTVTLELPSFISELRDLISVCQQHSLSEEQLIEIGRAGNRGALVAAARILGEYRQQIRALNFLDPQQLIPEAKRAIESFPQIRPQLSHVLIDDAQEFSTVELELVSAIAGRAQLVVFADPDATVLGFRAAAPEDLGLVLGSQREVSRADLSSSSVRPAAISEAMDKLVARIPTAGAGSHRSSILAAVRSAASSSLAAEVDHSTSSEFDEDLANFSANVFNSVSAESDFLADRIRILKVRKQLDWSEIALVLRTRSQIDQLSVDLSQHGIPVIVPSSQTALSDFGVAGELLKFLSRVQEIENLNRAALESLLGGRLSALDAIEIRTLRRKLGSSSEGYVYALRAALMGEGLEELRGPAVSKLRRFSALVRLARDAAGWGAHRAVSELWKATGLEAKLEADASVLSEIGFAAQRDLDSMVELSAAAIRFDAKEPTGGAVAFARELLAQEVADDSLVPPSRTSAVSLLTPASLLGRRFRAIFAPRLQEGIWPNLRPRNSLLSAASIESWLRGRQSDPLAPVRSELQHELRSFYKTIGATTEYLQLSAVELDDESPSQFFSMMGVSTPAPVSYRREHDVRARVAAMRRELRRDPNESVATRLAAYALLGAPGAHPESWYGRLLYTSNSPIDQNGSAIRVSPSQLEKFQKCPLHWFISAYGGESRAFEASVGTLLHEAFELGEAGGGEMWAFVQSKWGQLNIESAWQDSAERRRAFAMVEALASYLTAALEAGIQVLEREKFLAREAHGLEIRGSIDRLERLADGSLRVLDLKTGTVGSKAEVAKNLQLALYQLLVEQAYPDDQLSGAAILAVKGGKVAELVQPKLDDSFREQIRLLLERARTEFPGPSFAASVGDHCGEPGSPCGALIVPELDPND